MKILFFGDITGKAGREAVREILPILREKHSPDLVIANGENIAHGKGITEHTVQSVFDAGVDFLTSGNHVFDKPGCDEIFAKYSSRIIRPANFTGNLPGKGYALVRAGDAEVLIINLNGQVFMDGQFDHGGIENPFLALDQILAEAGGQTPVRILDIHAEATSEKRAMGFYADGRASLVVGSHTHISTRDAQILPKGTGYQSDLGMVGSKNSVIGVKVESVLKRFQEGEGLSKSPLVIDEDRPYEIGYIVAEIDASSGKCQNIEGYLEYLE